MNTFPEAHDLLSKAHEIGAHFRHDEKRNKELYSYKNNVSGGLVRTHITLDLNETRVLDRQNLEHSILRRHKRLACYVNGKDGNCTQTSDYFLKLAEMEGTLFLSVKKSTLSECGQFLTGTLGVVANSA